MEFHVEFLHPHNMLFGFSYKDGQGVVNGEEVVFHEFGLGLILINFYLVIY